MTHLILLYSAFIKSVRSVKPKTTNGCCFYASKCLASHHSDKIKSKSGSTIMAVKASHFDKRG